MNLKHIPDCVVDACRERNHSDDNISRMSPVELFHEYCQWEGLINYGRQLWQLMESLKEGSEKDATEE